EAAQTRDFHQPICLLSRVFVIQHEADGRSQPVRLEHDYVTEEGIMLEVDQVAHAATDAQKQPSILLLHLVLPANFKNAFEWQVGFLTRTKGLPSPLPVFRKGSTHLWQSSGYLGNGIAKLFDTFTRSRPLLLFLVILPRPTIDMDKIHHRLFAEQV